MKEFLSQHGVEYQELNVAEDEKAREEMFQLTGRLAVPVVTHGSQLVVGFNPGELEQLIRQ